MSVLLHAANKNVMPGAIMRISCPGCGTEYDVPEAALAKGSRVMRCVRCAHQWTYRATPAAETAALQAAPAPLPRTYVGAAQQSQAAAEGAVAVRPAQVQPVPDMPTPPRPLARSLAHRGKPPVLATPGGLSILLVVVVLVVAILAEHDALVRLYPNIRPLFTALGLS